VGGESQLKAFQGLATHKFFRPERGAINIHFIVNFISRKKNKK
jgi:hypothetical protein